MTVVDQIIERIRRVSPTVRDIAIGLWIFGIGAVGPILHWDHTAATQLGLFAIASAGVVARRRAPRVAFAIVLLAVSASLITKTTEPFLALLVMVYTVSEESKVALSVAALVAALVADYVAIFPQDVLAGLRHLGADVAQLPLANGAWIALAWFAGRMQARRRAIASDLGQTVDQLQQERDRLAHTAVATERRRIARELHALVVDGIEQMNVKTRGARRQLSDDPQRASRTIAEMEGIGRHTLVEMRRLLLILREGREDIMPLGDDLGGAQPASSDGRLPPEPFPDPEEFSPARGIRKLRRWIAEPWATDVMIVLVMAVLAAAEPHLSPWYSSYGGEGYVLTAAIITGAFLFRRQIPLLVFAVVATAIFVANTFHPLGGGAGFMGDRAMFVAVFTVAAFRGPRWGMVALTIMVLTLGRSLITLGNLDWELEWSAQMVFAVVAGVAVWEGDRLNEKLAEQSEALRRTREERVRRAVDEDRSRIARDVHDMVAHGVTLMVIQAGAARWLAEGDPAKAEHALGSVERAGQDALRELSSLVGSLGTSSIDGAEPLSASERLTVSSLVDRAVQDGMRVELVIRGEPLPLDGGLEISLYRVIQEALTNARKHAPGAGVRVAIAYTPEGVDVEVTDTGRHDVDGRAATVPGAGHGLVGIAERTALFGGHLECGPTPEGGFRVHASLGAERVPV